ncbi:bifunctional diaminohydroxyphosphoribosylaminopyrimidine deaminase/5-amino-6-(5-phosphoribosylamino)uracil reductase RibD [Bdellovibrionota bacterium FG-2]
MIENAISAAIAHAFDLALEEAQEFVGATAPNPPVGAAALDAQGRILGVAAHQKAGEAHAEAALLTDLKGQSIDTLIVTLEPCNHTGRTPPCSQAIIAAGVRRVIYGVADPNPRVAGGGARALRDAGIEVMALPEGHALFEKCLELARPFIKWVTTGLPFVTVKTAYRGNGSMIPPLGMKTFTTSEALRIAHDLRKRSDAILTGSGTIQADNPAFTVRHVADHFGKKRWLAIMDRRRRVPEKYLEYARRQGFNVILPDSLEAALRELGSNGVLEVLVEAGPLISEAVLSGELWDRHVVLTEGQDEATIHTRAR